MNPQANTLPRTTVDEAIERCWMNGTGINDTRQAVRRRCGVTVSAEDVRLRFVELAERWG